MKKRKNIIINILMISMLMILLCFSFFKNTSDWNSIYKNQENIYNKCFEIDYSNNASCKYLIENHDNINALTADTISIFLSSLTSPSTSWINYILIIILIFPSLLSICQLFKSRAITNILNRQKYTDVIKHLLKDALKGIYIVIIPLIFLFIISYLYSGHFNYNYILYSGSYYSFYANINPILYIAFYFICISLFCIFLINIGLIIARKNHNIIIVLIESFLLFIAIDIFLELIFGVLLSNIIFGGFSSRINLVNILNIGYAQNIIEMIITPTILALGSFIVVIIKYKNKEALITDCEKNN